MKKWVVLALCFCSSLVSASTIEEVIVTARHVKILLVRVTDSHKQNPVTGSWHYVAPANEKGKEREERSKD